MTTKHYISLEDADKYYNYGFDIYVETTTVIKVDHKFSDNIDDNDNISSVSQNNKYYIEIESLIQ